MAAILPILLVAGAATAVMMGRNMEQISPSTADAMEGAWDATGDATSSVAQGLQNFVAQDAAALEKGRHQSDSDSRDGTESPESPESPEDGDHEYEDSDDDASSQHGRTSDEDHEYGDSDEYHEYYD